jgi:tetratricopeptide (TPR) repeat protein
VKTLLRFAVFALAVAGAGWSAAAPMPLLEGLGPHRHPVTTKSPEAQKYFDQGLNLLFGFNHGAAIRSFEEAVRLDPTCAMAYWGVALANGPHINFPMVPPPNAEAAWRAMQQAQKYAPNATPLERDLIAALATRYAHPQPEDRSPLDRAYADAMRKVWQAHPDAADAGVLFAEALMDLRPWDQWTPEGQPQPGTDEVLATLDAVLKLEINHPFANHLYIHAVEASPHPERALAAADRLRDLQPGIAHNVHMPSHVYIRTGRWFDAVTSNLKAVEASRKIRARRGPPEGFIVFYNAHDRHMLAYAAMMTGQSALALEHINAMVAEMPAEVVKEYAMFADGFVAMPFEVLLRFGRWDDVLAAPEPAEYLPFARAFRHVARGVAFAAKGDVKAAQAEQELFIAGARLIPPEDTIGNNSAQAVAEIARHMLAGEILFRDGKVDEGVAELREAVKLEDALRYDEPPPWILPTRHVLGAQLMQARRFAEAEQVYRDDLKRLPNDAWALFGLAESLRFQHRLNEAKEVDGQFKVMWAKADITVHSSCLCQPGL